MSPSPMPGLRPGRAACLVALACAASVAGAQAMPAGPAGGRPARPDAVNAAAPALPAEPSAFRAHRPFSDAPPSNWRGANDTVGRVGGWRAYAREAQQDAGPKPEVPERGALPHGGHR